MRRLAEQPRRVTAVALVAFVFVLTLVGVGGAIADNGGDTVTPDRSRTQLRDARAELVTERRTSERARQDVRSMVERARRWKARAQRAERRLRADRQSEDRRSRRSRRNRR